VIGPVEGNDAIALSTLRDDKIVLHHGPPEFSLMASRWSCDLFTIDQPSGQLY
jgi:hypothetical protein